MFGIGVQELLIVLVILLLLFGGKKLPELSKSLGQAIREVRKGLNNEDNAELENAKTKKRRSAKNSI